jgi:hypothetical protein
MTETTSQPTRKTKWVWLPEVELVIALSPVANRSELIVAAATESRDGSAVILVATADGRMWADLPNRFERSGNGLLPDFTKTRPADYGHTLSFGEYEASAAVVVEESEPVGTLFDPADFDGTAPDLHATAEQHVLLDRAIAVLDRSPDRIAAEDLAEWKAVIAGLHKTIPGLYGCEWIHRGWNLMLHGHQMFSDRWTPEVAHNRGIWWEEFLAAPKVKVAGRRLPEMSADELK